MLVAEDLNIFRRLTAENENSTTELLANLMSRKYLRNLLLPWFIPDLTVEMLESEINVRTQKRIDMGGQPDLLIEGSDFLLIIENKTKLYTEPTGCEITSYIQKVKEVHKKIKKLVYLIPLRYAFKEKFESVAKNNADFVKIKFWEDLLSFFDYLEIAHDSSVIRDALVLFRSVIDLERETKEIQLVNYEVAIMYENDIIFDVLNFISKLMKRIENMNSDLISALNAVYHETDLFSSGNSQQNECGCGRYISMKGGGCLFYGISQVSDDRDISKKYGFSIAIHENTPRLDVKIYDCSKDKEGWYYCPLNKRVLLENSNDLFIDAVVSIVSKVIPVRYSDDDN